MSTVSLQLVLSGFKGATDVSICTTADSDYLYVFLGLALLERVPNDPQQFLYQLMIARLVNSGVSQREIVHSFNHDSRTIKSWAAAVLSGDIEQIMRAFSGRGPAPKMTAEIRSFIHGQYLLLREICLDYRKRIRCAVHQRFGVEFSDGYLSRLFAELTDDADVQAEEVSVRVEEEEREVESAWMAENESQENVDSASAETEAVIYSPAPGADTPKPDLLPVSGMPVPQHPMLLHHAGGVIFSPWLDLVGFDRPDELQMHGQWLAQILQGAVNVEQSKKLCAPDLALLNGPVFPSQNRQRNELSAQAELETADEILLRNSRLLGADGPCGGGDVFYYDPHGKEYTGAQTILKGWCGKRHKISKMLYLDIVHTRNGSPCYIYHADNYYDMRERFFLMLHRFNQQFPTTRPRTWVIDRGIYGLDTFDAFQSAGEFFITWEKGYQKNGLDSDRTSITFRRSRTRNHSADIQTWHFECQEQPWAKNPAIRQIIAVSTAPNGTTVEVSILCSNPDISLQEAVTLICNRWIQENDFGYLDTHFGLLQITSYATEEYQNIEHTLHDRDVATAEFKRLKKNQQLFQASLKKLLLKREEKADLINQYEKQRQQLKARQEENQLPADELKQVNRRIRALQKKIKTQQGKKSELNQTISKLKTEAAQIQEKLDQTLKMSSRLDQLIAGNYSRLDVRKKAVMDALRITARNIFYSAMELFRPIYNNYRDDHVILRLITQSPGLIWYDKKHCVTEIRLWLSSSLQPHQLTKIRQFLQVMTEGINQHFKDQVSVINLDLLNDEISVVSVGVSDHTP